MKKQIFTQLICASILLGVSASYAMESGGQVGFVHAAGDGHLNLVKQSLQQQDVDINGFCDCTFCGCTFKLTALVNAVAQGHGEVARFLLEQGAAVNKPSGGGQRNTALIVAAGNDNLAILKLLLENGADMDAKNKNNITALNSAVLPGIDRRMVTVRGVKLCTFRVSKSPNKVPDVVKHLLVAGCDHTVKDEGGKTAHDRAEDAKTKEMLANPDTYMQEHPEEFEAARTWYRNWQQKAQEKSCYCCGKNEQDALQEKLSRCSQCKKALYCSRTCQSKDWKKHKQNCKPKKQEEKKQERTCCYCGKSEQESAQKKLSRCSQCKKALYCDRSCQRSGWKTHKENCNK